jgi:hypothetical protein
VGAPLSGDVSPATIYDVEPGALRAALGMACLIRCTERQHKRTLADSLRTGTKLFFSVYFVRMGLY